MIAIVDRLQLRDARRLMAGKALQIAQPAPLIDHLPPYVKANESDDHHIEENWPEAHRRFSEEQVAERVKDSDRQKSQRECDRNPGIGDFARDIGQRRYAGRPGTLCTVDLKSHVPRFGNPLGKPYRAECSFGNGGTQPRKYSINLDPYPRPLSSALYGGKPGGEEIAEQHDPRREVHARCADAMHSMMKRSPR